MIALIMGATSCEIKLYNYIKRSVLSILIGFLIPIDNGMSCCYGNGNWVTLFTYT